MSTPSVVFETPAAHAAPNMSLPAQVAAAAASAGLQVVSSAPSNSFDGTATTKFALALGTAAAAPARTTQLELSQSFDAANPEFAAQLTGYLAETARRLENPQANTMVSLSGLPLAYGDFEWPFHASTAGADTELVHGQISLALPAADGTPSPLHAKIAASMTVTFREVVQAPEQPFAESFILNAVRKTLDQGQIELVKSGNRQPVPVTTRFYSSKSKKFVFNDTTEPERKAFLAAKAFWLSGVLGARSEGGYAPVWLLDPRDAQYLNATVAELKVSLDALAKDGTIVLAHDPAYATPSDALMGRREQYEAEVAKGLAYLKPTFNESMRSGQTNM